MTTKVLRKVWSQLDRWLAKRAPRTRATLLPPVDAETVRAAVAAVGRVAPEELVALYGLAGGQRDDTPAGEQKVARGIFDGYWFLPLEGVDGLAQTLADWKTAMEAGAVWATPDRFPFAKDFSGAYLCIETHRSEDDEDEDGARIVEAGDCEPDVVSESLLGFLDRTFERLQCGEVTIDERVEVRERHEVLFDACRPRTIGDVLKHSVFEKLAIRATVEDTAEALPSHPWEKVTAQVFGLAVRLVSDREIDIEEVGLVDPYDTPIPATTGKSWGGGKPGACVYVWDKKPLPERSRLRVMIAGIRRV